LPGTPDLVFPKWKAVVLVHGCFWHRHSGCRACSTPSTNVEFWQRKFERNVDRDAKAEASLLRAGWRVLVIWECQTRDTGQIRALLAGHLTDLAAGSAEATVATTRKPALQCEPLCGSYRKVYSRRKRGRGVQLA
jgi:DNA mismatch endonuclease (patch repair protein)